MADETELLHINGHTFDLDDLTYAERREIKRVARTRIYDEEVDGDFAEMNDDDLMPALILVFMRRHDPAYTLEMAQQMKPGSVFSANGGPPTQPQDNDVQPVVARKRSGRSTTAAKIPAGSGNQS